eukprot:3028696-Rhodomonas_salina.1
MASGVQVERERVHQIRSGFVLHFPNSTGEEYPGMTEDAAVFRGFWYKLFGLQQLLAGPVPN